ncbi:unnamed protein product [Rotaria sordida]|uniref:Chitin-binding type-2 domain-containing protein n=1 Tax=Rotaria sordida TaxID=392033 RepID=A0A819WTR5_9BILA|nr:unnamed protein product [Rotaria sordida]
MSEYSSQACHKNRLNCEPYPNGALLANPDDPHSFYQCSNGIGYLLQCPANLVWNQQKQVCDFGDNVPKPDKESTSTIVPTVPEELTTTNIVLPLQCSNHTVIDDPTRHILYNATRSCDDENLGWVRFIDGTNNGRSMIIPTVQPPYLEHCGAVVPGWLKNFTYPTTLGTTVQASVCFDFVITGSTARFCMYTIDIQITNCGQDFFVFNLPAAPRCNLRYCTI